LTQVHDDGTLVQKDKVSTKMEDIAAERLKKHFKWDKLERLAGLNDIDYYAEKLDRHVANLEIKGCKYDHGKYTYAVFSQRKWLALALVQAEAGTRGILSSIYMDGKLFYVWIDGMGPVFTHVIERKGRGLKNDREPMFHVQLKYMTEVK